MLLVLLCLTKCSSEIKRKGGHLDRRVYTKKACKNSHFYICVYLSEIHIWIAAFSKVATQFFYLLCPQYTMYFLETSYYLDFFGFLGFWNWNFLFWNFLYSCGSFFFFEPEFSLLSRQAALLLLSKITLALLVPVDWKCRF